MSLRDSIVIIHNSQYKKYIDEHRDNVMSAWLNLKKHLYCILEKHNESIELQLMKNNIKNHDMSKYSKEEFDAYRKRFFPVDDIDKNKEAQEEFDKAWEHHYTNNLHHWEWWAKTKNENNMKTEYVIEMVCDWIAMSKKFGGTAEDWYYKQKDIILGEKQKRITVDLLYTYYKIYE